MFNKYQLILFVFFTGWAEAGWGDGKAFPQLFYRAQAQAPTAFVAMSDAQTLVLSSSSTGGTYVVQATADLAGGQWVTYNNLAGTITGGLQLVQVSLPPAAVPRTGQTNSLTPGDDGARRTGVAWPEPRFTTQTNDTVVDNLTGLIWTRNAAVLWVTNDWAAAVGFCSNLTHGGQADWRLPNVRELLSLVDYGRYDPALPAGHPFTNVISGLYWTASPYPVLSSGMVYMVDLGQGQIVYHNTNDQAAVWPVRGP